MATPLVRVVFALLVLVTIGAFFVTQQLKGEFPLVLRFATAPKHFSPNGDGFRDRTRVGFDLSEPAKISFSVIDGEGNEVRRLVNERELAGDTKHRFSWDGRDDEGRRVGDGSYRMRVRRRDEGRVIDSIKQIRLDTRPPRVALTSARPGVISPGAPGERPQVRIRYRGPRNEAPELRVFRTDGGPPRVVFRLRGDRSRSAVWDGYVRGRPAAEGNYAFSITVRDRAGNVAVAPQEIPSPGSARAGTGVAVRRFTLRGPLGVVAAGSLANLEVGPLDRSLEFALSRLGSRRTSKRGERIGGRFRVRIPRNARTGVYVVRVRAGRRRAVWPVAVAGLPPSRRAARRPRPLVVLPAISWQGENPIDDDLDGFANTLASARSVSLERPFAGGRLPPRLRREVAPFLLFLDRERLAYDLTTDLALARGEGPALGNAPGVAFPGSARWLPQPLARRLRRYVDSGGRVASFGADAFRRTVTLRGGLLLDPSPARPANAFGERTALLRTGNAPLLVSEDELGLFEGLTTSIGDFTFFEESTSLPSGSRKLSSAGREPERPAFIAFRLGRGFFVRSGTPQWSRELAESRLSLEVPRVTARVWRLLRAPR
ncbi:MAG TPA: N,N-dimethylformamidase beta subunit family domain-containing protein [Thermoleophilaceae bacterium]|nr:N,N-dimethylformamidase beta subunit family domain-containing protein [Thermoleophilaceae bacterium]